MLFELGHHGGDFGSGDRLRLCRCVPIPIRPQRIKPRRSTGHQQRSQRTDEAAFLIAHQRHGYDCRGDRSHEGCDDDKGAHSSMGMRERCRAMR